MFIVNMEYQYHVPSTIYTVYDNVYIVKFYSDPSPPCIYIAIYINYANLVDQGGEREQNVRYYWELTMTQGGTTIAIVHGGSKNLIATCHKLCFMQWQDYCTDIKAHLLLVP